MHGTRNQQIICAYALLFTVGGGLVGYDLCAPVDREFNGPASLKMVAALERPAPVASQAPARTWSELPQPEAPQPNREIASFSPSALEKPKRIAPPGTVYVITRISRADNSGIHTLAPGTSVRLLLRVGTNLKVTDGRHDFQVASTQVTTDVDLAENLAREMTLAGGLARQ